MLQTKSTSHKKHVANSKYVPTHSFSITKKLTTDSMVNGIHEKRSVYKKVSFWIVNDPLHLWHALYGGKIQLAKDAHQRLMVTMAEKYPELYQEKQKRRLNYLKIKENRQL